MDGPGSSATWRGYSGKQDQTRWRSGIVITLNMTKVVQHLWEVIRLYQSRSIVNTITDHRDFAVLCAKFGDPLRLLLWQKFSDRLIEHRVRDQPRRQRLGHLR